MQIFDSFIKMNSYLIYQIRTIYALKITAMKANWNLSWEYIFIALYKNIRGHFAKYLFLGYNLLKIYVCMCSYKILRKLSWIFWCVLVRFLSLGIYVLVPFLVLLKNCFYKRIMSSLGKVICFLIACKPPGKFEKRFVLGKKNTYFSMLLNVR